MLCACLQYLHVLFFPLLLLCACFSHTEKLRLPLCDHELLKSFCISCQSFESSCAPLHIKFSCSWVWSVAMLEKGLPEFLRVILPLLYSSQNIGHFSESWWRSLQWMVAQLAKWILSNAWNHGMIFLNESIYSWKLDSKSFHKHKK